MSLQGRLVRLAYARDELRSPILGLLLKCSAGSPLATKIRNTLRKVTRKHKVPFKADREMAWFQVDEDIWVHEGSTGWAVGHNGQNYEFGVDLDKLESIVSGLLSKAPAEAKPQGGKKELTSITNSAEISKLRTLVRAIGKRHGLKLTTKKGTGSHKGDVIIQENSYPTTEDPAARIELVRALIRRGYESSFVEWDPSQTLKNHDLRLALEDGHAKIYLVIKKWS